MNQFLIALEDGEARVQRCRSCRARQAPAGHACRSCGGTALEWVSLDEPGRVYAITEVHRAPDADFSRCTPFGVAIVDFGDGLRLMGHAADGLRIDDAARARPKQIAGRTLLHFAPVVDTHGNERNDDG